MGPRDAEAGVHCAWVCYWAAVSHTAGPLGCLLEKMVLGGEGRILKKGDSGKGGFAYREKSRIALQQQEPWSNISNYPTTLL